MGSQCLDVACSFKSPFSSYHELAPYSFYDRNKRKHAGKRLSQVVFPPDFIIKQSATLRGRVCLLISEYEIISFVFSLFSTYVCFLLILAFA